MKLLLPLLLLGPALATAQPATPQQRTRSELRLTAERIELPGGERLGLVGAGYLFEVAPGVSVGPMLYGAASGQRGGLFVFGVEGSWRRALAGPLELQLGTYVGGGGGGNAPVGGGLMWRPHADLLWNFGGWRAGVSASSVRFSNGDIGSRQLGLVLSADTEFAHLPADARASARVDGRSGLGFDRLLLVGGAYRPRAGTLGVSGQPLKSSIAYVGARAEQLVAAPWVWGVEANGAGSGGAAGYAEFLASVGAETALLDGALRVGARAALGLGGGGDLPMGGGLLTKAALTGTLRLSRSASLSAEGGWASAPRGDFRAPFAALALNWNLDAPAAAGAAAGPTREEGVVGTETYRLAARRAGPPRHLQAIVFKFNRFVGDTVYLTGQAHSAWGGGAGAYSVGLVGVGAQWRPADRWLVGAELLAGVAGGGGVDTGNGPIVQPMVYAGWRFTPSLSARLGAGRVKATQGGLASNVVDVGLAYAFSAGHRH